MTRWPTLRTPSRGNERDGSLAQNGGSPRLRTRDVAQTANPAKKTTRLQRLRQPLPLLGIALVLIALIGYVAVYSSANRRTGILVLTRSLQAGATLQAADLKSEPLAAPAPVLAALEPSNELEQAVGRQLQSSVTVGEPLTRAAITTQAIAPAAFTLDVPASTTDGEDLTAGDRVIVLATFGAGTGQVTTKVLARGLDVLGVGQPPADANLTSTTVPVTVALGDVSVSTQLALANEAGKIDLLREGANVSTAAIPNASQAGSGVGS